MDKMMDIAIAKKRYEFIGREFLTWLWYTIENDRGRLLFRDGAAADLGLGGRVTLKSNVDVGKKTVSLNSDASTWDEAVLALKNGAWVSDLALLLKSSDGQREWSFSLKANGLRFSTLKTPKVGPGDGFDLESLLIERSAQMLVATDLIEFLFSGFAAIRLSAEWPTALGALSRWVRELTESAPKAP